MASMHARILEIVATSILILSGLASAQLTSTCTKWAEPQTYQAAIVAEANPANDRRAVILGKPQRVMPMRIRFIESETGLRLNNEGVAVNYGWRWLEYPYPEHAWGAWRDASDRLSCELDASGWIETPAHEVRPRGWYKGKYTRWPWQHTPSFTDVELVAVTQRGFARVHLTLAELGKFQSNELVVVVSDGWRTELRWEKRK